MATAVFTIPVAPEFSQEVPELKKDERELKVVLLHLLKEESAVDVSKFMRWASIQQHVGAKYKLKRWTIEQLTLGSFKMEYEGWEMRVCIWADDMFVRRVR